ncbi:PaaI family thioesterase [Futiania mangrovi]|uniref:PaaI family thioesterase n=1 Tax=Futiania mangrovi TaxID=2959716 RepID=A0A9J6PBH5_9PROT|nr:PaaI family thioesterase [Futiania mangrovii]MCP1337492.1 PaaI family thioesterase [Futiania mangrovii]
MTLPPLKTRTYTYRENRFDPAELADITGLEMLQQILAGERAPPSIAATLNFAFHEVGPGRVVFRGEPADFAMNPIGVMHGGWAATLLDSCMACAVQTTLPRGTAYTTAELSVNLTRAILPSTGPLLAIGTVIHGGRRVGTAEGRLVGEKDGKLYAHGTTTCVIFPVE